MFKKLKVFLQKIQNSDEATKKRWLIGVTAISMILVIGLWLIYIQSTVKSIGNNIEDQESTIGFWQIFKNGLVVVFNSVKENIKIIISEITKSRIITVE
jgi:uncharacterized Rmd1/YagE family protein